MSKSLTPQNAGLPARQERSVALVLGGGGARGLAHIVALEALEDMGVRPLAIAGTSIGAIFGAAAASGMSSNLIRAHVEELLSKRYALVRQLFSARAQPIQKLFNIVPWRAALLDPEALLELILPSQIPSTFEALQIPLSVVATDFYAQEATLLHQGPLRPAIAASIALPVLFEPVTIAGNALMDGGLVDPLPFDSIKVPADITIAIDVSGAPREPGDTGVPRAMEALFASSQILQRSIVREKLKSTRPDIYLDAASGGVGVLEFHRFREILAAAAPLKETLKRQLDRVLSAETAKHSPSA